MAFVVTLVALLFERFFDWSHLLNWRWYLTYQQKIADYLLNKPPFFILIATILPVLLLVGLINWLSSSIMYGFVKLWLHIFIVFYCLAPKNFWADVFACLNNLTQKQLQERFGNEDMHDSPSLHRSLLDHIFIESYHRIFAILFWYLILGILGAVFYRLITLSAENNRTPKAVMSAARSIECVLDWLPIRIYTFLFVLGGRFASVISCWRKNLLLDLDSKELLLIECGNVALGFKASESLRADSAIEKHALRLVDRTLLISLILIAIWAFLF